MQMQGEAPAIDPKKAAAKAAREAEKAAKAAAKAARVSDRGAWAVLIRTQSGAWTARHATAKHQLQSCVL